MKVNVQIKATRNGGYILEQRGTFCVPTTIYNILCKYGLIGPDYEQHFRRLVKLIHEMGITTDEGMTGPQCMDVLYELGIPCCHTSVKYAPKERISYWLSHNHVLIVFVDAGILWKDKGNLASGLINHCLLIEKETDKSYIVRDTGNGRRRYDKSLLLESLGPDAISVYGHDAIRPEIFVDEEVMTR